MKRNEYGFSELEVRHAWFYSLLAFFLRRFANVLVRPRFRAVMACLRPNAPFQVRLGCGVLRGWRMVLNRSCHPKVWVGSYEWRLQQRAREIVRPGDTVFDIGAHVGFFTMVFACLVGERGKVVAFEPCPCNIPYVQKNITLNMPRTANVTLVSNAVGDRTEVRSLHGGKGPSTMPRLNGIPLRGAGAEKYLTETFEVQTVSLDEWCRKNKTWPDVLKVDVEGGEIDVLRGAADLMKTKRPVILLEAHRWVSLEALDEMVRQNRYHVEDLNGQVVREGISGCPERFFALVPDWRNVS